MSKCIRFGSGSISATTFGLPLDDFLEATMRNHSLIKSTNLNETKAKKALTDLYKQVNKDEKPTKKVEDVMEQGIGEDSNE
jgi:hypothetical protein